MDLVDTKRIERLISRNEDIFRARMLGERERLEIPSSGNSKHRVRAYAESIAAKEAFLKALGTGLTVGMRWPDIEVVGRESASPRLAIHGLAERKLSQIDADSMELTLTSTTSNSTAHAMAIVLLTRSEPEQNSL